MSGYLFAPYVDLQDLDMPPPEPMLKFPVIYAHINVSDNKGIYFFSDTVCYGNPVKGPWLEKRSNGVIRKFEEGEIPIGGHSAAAKKVKDIYTSDEETRDKLKKLIDDEIREHQITIPDKQKTQRKAKYALNPGECYYFHGIKSYVVPNEKTAITRCQELGIKEYFKITDDHRIVPVTVTTTEITPNAISEEYKK